jgi:hypothetical protein
MTDDKPKSWRAKLLDNIIDKGSWGLLAFILAAGWGWYQRLPSNNLNIRSVAVKIPNPSSEKPVDICVITDKGKQEISKFVAANPNMLKIDREVLQRVTENLVISDLDRATQSAFKKIQSTVCNKSNSEIRNPPWLEIVAILSTEASYLLDRDCTLSIINEKGSTGISDEFWNQQPTVNLVKVPQEQAPTRLIWNFTPLPRPKRLTLLHSGLPIRAIVNKTTDESFLVTETQSYDFEANFDRDVRRKFYSDHILKYLKRGNKLPISITCTIQSVGQEPFQVTSEPFYAEVGYREPNAK